MTRSAVKFTGAAVLALGLALGTAVPASAGPGAPAAIATDTGSGSSGSASGSASGSSDGRIENDALRQLVRLVACFIPLAGQSVGGPAGAVPCLFGSVADPDW